MKKGFIEIWMHYDFPLTLFAFPLQLLFSGLCLDDFGLTNNSTAAVLCASIPLPVVLPVPRYCILLLLLSGRRLLRETYLRRGKDDGKHSACSHGDARSLQPLGCLRGDRWRCYTSSGLPHERTNLSSVL